MKYYVPFTPGGSMLVHLESKTESEAWGKLIKEASHMPYNGKKGFQKRGYTVEEFDETELYW